MIKASVPFPLYYLLKILDRVLTSAADCVIVPSMYRAKLYPSARRIFEVPNLPKISETCQPGIKRSGKDSSIFTIYYGGSLSKGNATIKLVRLAARLSDIRLVLAGYPKGNLHAFLKKAATTLPNLSYLGEVDRSISLSLLCTSDVTIVMYEPCNINNVYASSNKLFEAMMMGVPIVTNKETVASEIVEREACGLVVPYHDDAALEQAILTLKRDKKLWRKLHDSGRTASEKYSWEQFEASFLSKYIELINLTFSIVDSKSGSFE